MQRLTRGSVCKELVAVLDAELASSRLVRTATHLSERGCVIARGCRLASWCRVIPLRWSCSLWASRAWGDDCVM